MSQTINYDLNGNLTGYNGSSYSYDSQNRLVQALTPTHTLDYGYNPQGQRIRKTSTPSGGSASVTHYFHSGSNEIAEYTGTALKARYIYGPGTDEILAQIDYSGSAGSEAETSRRFFYSDGLGSVIATLDETGAVTKKYRYSPFGIHADTNDHSDQPWGYTGQRYDADSGLYYYKARYYHPSLGRFLSVDPVGYDDQMNLYAYVANRPMMFRDPSGRLSESLSNLGDGYYDLGGTTFGGLVDAANDAVQSTEFAFSLAVGGAVAGTQSSYFLLGAETLSRDLQGATRVVGDIPQFYFDDLTATSQTASRLNTLSRGFAYVGAPISTYAYLENFSNGNYHAATLNGFDLLMTGVSVYPPYGTAAGLVYFTARVVIDIAGQSDGSSVFEVHGVTFPSLNAL